MPIAYMCRSGEDSDGTAPKKKRRKKVFWGFPDVYPLEYEEYEPWIKVVKVPTWEGDADEAG
jgi:hypothetical protein